MTAAPHRLAEAICSVVQERDHVSFAELAQEIDGFRGDWTYRHVDFLQIYFWVGLSDEAFEAIENLRAAGSLHFEPCSTLIYICDGLLLQLPTVRSTRAYSKPHWLPVVLRPGADPAPARRRRRRRVPA